MHFTDEQIAIIKSEEPRIVVQAVAGSGKTSTLVEYARARRQKMLYLCYNKAIQTDAEQRMPINVVCKTTHALAFPKFGALYRHKFGNVRIGDIATRMGLSFPHAGLVSKTITAYLNSADEGIGDEHLPPDVDKKNAVEVSTILRATRQLWTQMQDIEDLDTPMPHDGYLKLYQLSRPVLPCTVLLVDEAQDLTPLVMSIVLAHTGNILMVGDSVQSIYGWRGAVDALSQLKDATPYALTHSFRFGPGIANCANLAMYWHGYRTRVVGAGACQVSRMEVDRTKPFATIGRTNMGVIAAAIEALEQPKPLHFVGGVESYRLPLIEDGYNLYCGKNGLIKDKFVAKMPSLAALDAYAEEAKDHEMGLLVRIVQTYGHKLPGIIAQLRARSIDSARDAERILTTAHRCKGLEFDQCVLISDFADLVDEKNQVIPKEHINPQDVNLIYVAVTRAREAVEICSQLKKYWDVMKAIWKAEAQERAARAATAMEGA